MNAARQILIFRLKASLPLLIDGGKTKWEIRNEIRGKDVDTVAVCLDTKQIVPIASSRSRVVDGRTVGMEFLARPGTIIYLIARKLIAGHQAEAVDVEPSR